MPASLDLEHFLVYSDFIKQSKMMMEAEFIKNTTKVLANIPIISSVNIMLPFTIGSTLRRQIRQKIII